MVWGQLCGFGQTRDPSPGLSFDSSPQKGGIGGDLDEWSAAPLASLLLGSRGAGKESGPPARPPEGWEMSRPGN